MTHQLSNLQQSILALCLDQKFMSCNELLLELWDLQPQEPWSKKYASAHASLSRSLTRLYMKNLIVYWKTINRSKTGITLTPDGQTLIRAILEEAEEA
jgi:hypothetical protein